MIDVLIHGWDLAVGTSQETKLDPKLVEACWEVVEPQRESLGGSGAFGETIDLADDCPLQTRLLAALGRKG